MFTVPLINTYRGRQAEYHWTHIYAIYWLLYSAYKQPIQCLKIYSIEMVVLRIFTPICGICLLPKRTFIRIHATHIYITPLTVLYLYRFGAPEGHLIHDNGMTAEHYHVMTWKHFTHYWSFVRGIHRSPVDSALLADLLSFWFLSQRASKWEQSCFLCC